MSNFRPGFLWGVSSAPHQIEGNNLASDWWRNEAMMPGMEPSGDAVDSYHRYREDMQLIADAGLDTYRFGIEWARIEPRSRPCLPGRARPLPAHDRHRSRAWSPPDHYSEPLHDPAVVRRGRRLERRHGVRAVARLHRHGHPHPHRR